METPLYNLDGDAVAYLADDESQTIYLWATGEPVAYLRGNVIYGNNGKFIGNYINGVVTNSNGDRIGANEQAHRGGEKALGPEKIKMMKPAKQGPSASISKSKVDDEIILNPLSLIQNLRSGLAKQ